MQVNDRFFIISWTINCHHSSGMVNVIVFLWLRLEANGTSSSSPSVCGWATIIFDARFAKMDLAFSVFMTNVMGLILSTKPVPLHALQSPQKKQRRSCGASCVRSTELCTKPLASQSVHDDFAPDFPVPLQTRVYKWRQSSVSIHAKHNWTHLCNCCMICIEYLAVCHVWLHWYERILCLK